MTLDEFERYLEKTGDLSPIYCLLDKFVRDPRARRKARRWLNWPPSPTRCPRCFAAAGFS